MTPRVRARMLWAMACLVLGYALLNVIVYFVSGSFGTGWFVASLAVYGLAFAGAILLLAAERPEEHPASATVQVLNAPGARFQASPDRAAPAEDAALVVADTQAVVPREDAPSASGRVPRS